MNVTPYDVRIPELDDDVILACDPETGTELLSFLMNWDGKSVRVKFPTHGNFRRFFSDVAKLLQQLGSDVEKIEIPDDMTGSITLDRFADWARMTAVFMVNKSSSDEVERIFFAYLRPHVDGVEVKDLRQWFDDNAPFDAVVRMFAALLSPDNYLKKKCLSLLEKTFGVVRNSQPSKGRRSTPTAKTNGVGMPSPLIAFPNFA